jgi:hypothetical protein
MDSGKGRVNSLILQVVENQLRDNKPAEARQAFERLTGAGFSEEDTKHLIGSAIVAEMRNVLKTSKPFDAERYRKLLDKLPELTKEQP